MQTKEVKHGVPKGPQMFLIYKNNAKVSKALQKRIKIYTKFLLKWLKANKISLNVAKTEVTIFKHNLKCIDFDFKIKLDGKRLIFREYVNYLGVLIDKNLNWSYHQEKLATNLRQANGVLSKIR